MTSSEAHKRATELNAAAEPGVRWMARQETPGVWNVIRVVIPGMARRHAPEPAPHARREPGSHPAEPQAAPAPAPPPAPPAEPEPAPAPAPALAPTLNPNWARRLAP